MVHQIKEQQGFYSKQTCDGQEGEQDPVNPFSWFNLLGSYKGNGRYA